MSKKIVKVLLAPFLILIISISFSTTKLYAQGTAGTMDSVNSVAETVRGNASAVANQNSMAAEKLSSKSAVKFKQQVCENRMANIKKRSTQMAQHVANLIKVFDSIVTRVENYYVQKLVPSGSTLSNYETLVADIQKNKAAVAPLVEKVNVDAGAFSCTADPIGQLTQFRKDMQGVIKGLQTYKKSVRNLIVAVVTLAKVEAKDATGSSKPDVTDKPVSSSSAE